MAKYDMHKRCIHVSSDATIDDEMEHCCLVIERQRSIVFMHESHCLGINGSFLCTAAIYYYPNRSSSIGFSGTINIVFLCQYAARLNLVYCLLV